MPKKAQKKAAPPASTREPSGQVRGKNVYDRIEKLGKNNEMGGVIPTRMLGKGVSAI